MKWLKLMESSFMRVIPKSLKTNIIGLAHEGHQYAEKTLQLLRQTCWFPGMSKQFLSYVEGCLPCNAAQAHTPPIPLEPNLLPDRPWQRLHADFKGPSKESITYMSLSINTQSIQKLIWLLLQVLRSLSLSWTMFLSFIAIQRQSLQIMASIPQVINWRSMQSKKALGWHLLLQMILSVMVSWKILSSWCANSSLLQLLKIRIQRRSHTTIYSIIVLLHIVWQHILKQS